MEAVEPFFRNYTRLVIEEDLVETLRSQLATEIESLRLLDNTEAEILHAPYTWTIKQVVGHLIDTETIFAYRALRFSRGDQTPLPGFEEGSYVEAAEFNSRPTQALVHHLIAVRKSTICFFDAIPNDHWSRAGLASGLQWTVTDLCQATIGHVRHHIRIIDQRLRRSG